MSKKSLVLNYPMLNQDPNLDLQTATDDTRFVYQVKRVKNSTAYMPGQRLMKTEVNDLCERGDWDVTVESFSGS